MIFGTPLTQPVIGKKVLHVMTGRLCKIIALHPEHSDIFIKVAYVNTGELFDDVALFFLKWWSVNWAMTVEFLVGFGEDCPNWLHEGF